MNVEKDEENAVVRLLQLRARAQGIALGLILAACIFVATNWLVIKGGENVGQHLNLLGQYLIGYRVTFVGSLIGAVWGLGIGFVLGYLISLIYNRLAAIKERRG